MRLTTGRGEAEIAAPLPPDLRADGLDGHAVELAVVQLDPALVDLDRQAERLGGLPGPPERAGDHPVGRLDGHRQLLGLHAAELVQRRVEPPLQEAAGVEVGPAVADEDEHACS